MPFSSASEQASGGNVSAEDVVPLTVELLNDFYSQVEPGYVALDAGSVGSFDSSKRSTIPKCGGSTLSLKQVQNRVFYCIDDDYVAFDQPYLQHIYDDIGDFGVTALLANPFATRVQTIQGEPGVADNDLATVFQADCYTGGFVAAMFNGALGGRGRSHRATSTRWSRRSSSTAGHAVSARRCRSPSCGSATSGRASSPGTSPVISRRSRTR